MIHILSNHCRYPDLILHFATSHDRKIFTAEELGVHTELLASYYSLYIPHTTKLVFFNKPHVELPLKDKNWTSARYEGLEENEQTRRMNAAHAEGLSKLVSERVANIFVFFDMLHIGYEMPGEWGLDGIHKKPLWYKTIVNYLSQLVC